MEGEVKNMTSVLWIALAVGTAMVLQAQFMGVMTERIGALESTFITYGLGGGLAALAILIARGGNLSEWRTVPWYVLLAGAVGLVIVSGLGISVSRIGVVGTMTLVIATQFLAGSVIDHFGLLEATARPFDTSRASGLAIVLVGTWLVLK